MRVKDEEFPTVRVSDKLLQETLKCADLVKENKSEYIRRAVEQRNKEVTEEEREKLGEMMRNVNVREGLKDGKN